jgi:hypothetical protein
MDNVPFQFFPFAFLVGIFALLQFAWYVAVIVFLYRIWLKVKHLPAS